MDDEQVQRVLDQLRWMLFGPPARAAPARTGRRARPGPGRAAPPSRPRLPTGRFPAARLPAVAARRCGPWQLLSGGRRIAEVDGHGERGVVPGADLARPLVRAKLLVELRESRRQVPGSAGVGEMDREVVVAARPGDH